MAGRGGQAEARHIGVDGFIGPSGDLIRLADELRAQMREAAGRAEAPSAALKAIGAAYAGFAIVNPAHYRLMFGTVLTPADACAPAVVEESAATAKSVLFNVIRQGVEQGSFAVPPEGLDMAVLSA